MDSPWRPNAYHATAQPLTPFIQPSSQSLELLQRQLQALSICVARQPHEINTWLSRADVLITLGYPELALGDCYRAELILSRYRQDNDASDEGGHQGQRHRFDPSATDLQIQHQVRCSQKFKPDEQSDDRNPSSILTHTSTEHDILECTLLQHFHRAFLQSNLLAHALETCLRGVKCFTSHAYFQDNLPMTRLLYEYAKARSTHAVTSEQRMPAEQHEALWGGSLLMRPYPWMTAYMLRRDETVVDMVREQVERASSGRCTVTSRSTAEGKAEDELGVFAMEEIPLGSAILVDPSPVGTAEIWDGRCECCYAHLPNRAERLNCCDAAVCSAECADLAMKMYHPALCKRSNPVTPSTQEASLLLSTDSLGRLQVLRRMLAVIIHSGAKDPLLAPTINHLKAQYRLSRPMYFNYHVNIVIPFRILESLGFDIFSETRFSTWVLHTIALRLNNNQHGGNFGQGRKTMALSPLYSLFNHSCTPNVVCRNVRGGTTVEMLAERDIDIGEELCISYLSDVSRRQRPERQALMDPWIGGECQCDRCESEKAEPC